MGARLNRREAIAGLGTVSLGALLAACSDDGDDPADPAPSDSGSSRFDDSPSCMLTAEQTEGPFYFDVDAIRSDIRDDRRGAELRLAIRVRDAEACAPLPNAVVDIWHCDAAGVYSGFEAGAGETFLRGTQVTDRRGMVEFTTIYPGWYQGRTVHIHAKVHLDRQTALTTQLYFDERVTRQVFARGPYASRGAAETTNARDGLFDDSLVLKPSRQGAAYAGAITFDVRRA